MSVYMSINVVAVTEVLRGCALTSRAKTVQTTTCTRQSGHGRRSRGTLGYLQPCLGGPAS